MDEKTAENCRVYACVNQKGGVGKSVSSTNLGVGLARRGQKVLIVDLDSQASQTVSLGWRQPDELPVTIATQLAKVVDNKLLDPCEGILHHDDGIDLMPSSIELSGLEMRMVNAMSREFVLKTYLAEVKPDYDAIILDCPPTLGISYTIKEVRNTGTTPLADFYWRDTLPTDAVRLTKVVTGSYNQALKYKVMITTNKGDTRVIADNLSTTKNNVVDCSNAVLGLKSDEYVTSVMLIFGTVKAGFAQVETPQIFVKVLHPVRNGSYVVNRWVRAIPRAKLKSVYQDGKLLQLFEKHLHRQN